MWSCTLSWTSGPAPPSRSARTLSTCSSATATWSAVRLLYSPPQCLSCTGHMLWRRRTRHSLTPNTPSTAPACGMTCSALHCCNASLRVTTLAAMHNTRRQRGTTRKCRVQGARSEAETLLGARWGSAPALRSTVTTRACPFSAARCSAVCPCAPSLYTLSSVHTLTSHAGHVVARNGNARLGDGARDFVESVSASAACQQCLHHRLTPLPRCHLQRSSVLRPLPRKSHRVLLPSKAPQSFHARLSERQSPLGRRTLRCGQCRAGYEHEQLAVLHALFPCPEQCGRVLSVSRGG